MTSPSRLFIAALALASAFAVVRASHNVCADDACAGAEPSCGVGACTTADCGAGVINCSSGVGDENHCCRCGSCCACCKVCRRVCEEKEVTKTTYCCKCEDFCVLGKSCEKDCDCSCGGSHSPANRPFCWLPTAKYIKTRHIPEKKVETKKVPVYTFKVVCLCPTCCDCTK
jgi:hypothetical protein